MLNKAIIYGRLVADPELRHTGNGVPVASFRVAVDRDFKDKQTGERKADFISVTAWRQTGEFVSRNFSKGSAILVEGRLQNVEYTDKQGNKRTTLEIQADNAWFGGPKTDAGSNSRVPEFAPPAFMPVASNEPLPFDMGDNPFDQLPL